MSVVAYYARVGEPDLSVLRSDPEKFWDLGEMSWDLTKQVDVRASECLYADKEWQVLSWLCSETGRAEERHQAALMEVDPSIPDADAFKAALAQQLESMGFSYADPRELAQDPVLTAIQGRREGDEGATIADLGLGAAVFNPQEVHRLAAALNGLDEGWVRERFDIEEMEALSMGGDYEETELDEFYLPALKRLQTLYNRAANAGQHVLVVMS